MIENILHKGLKKFYREGEERHLPPRQLEKIRWILALLDRAARPEDVNLPGLRCHPLKGEYRGFYAVTITANWRIIFRFEDGNVRDVDYLDYH